ncbi:glycosyltransferase, partial [Halococcus sp. AFM35]|uniref:glycosyltransferase n=1 Tax=Halococcus sp. AFM35 TaxID=3421653 RepID=UPI003EC00897
MDAVAVIPAYNEVETIGRVIDRTSHHVGNVVVVDDASSDGTAAVARNHGASVIEHTINHPLSPKPISRKIDRFYWNSQTADSFP